MESIDVYAISGVLNHFWLSALSEEHIKKGIGLKYISTMWERYPYWYVWFGEQKGVYKLELQQFQRLKGFDWLADFKLKYYPRQDESWFQGLSKLEKIARNSSIFENYSSFGESCCHGHFHEIDVKRNGNGKTFSSGAPLLEYSSDLPEDFYYAGNLQIGYKAEAGSLIKFKTQNYWQVIMSENYSIYDQNGHVCEVLPKGFMDRNYPGLEITDFFYQRLINAWQKVNNYDVCESKLWKGDGVCLKTDGGSLIQEKTSDIKMVIEQAEFRFNNTDLCMPLDYDIAEYHLSLM